MVTLVEGNEIDGSFYLNDTDAIAADASAEEMEILLEATGLGDVNVTRYQNREGSSIHMLLSFNLNLSTYVASATAASSLCHRFPPLMVSTFAAELSR